MIAAIYARYSSENQREASIEDQYRNCERYAAREGWTIVQRYKDQAISGMTTERPGYQRMLKDAQAKAFDILLVDDFSRLSRDSIETEQVRRRVVHWGVRLIGVSDGIDTAAKGHKMLAGFKGLMNEQYIEDLREKIARGMQGQALKGFHCGGRIYGYKLVPVLHPTKTDPYGNPEKIGTKLAIDPAQAKWVKWIFERYADGMSPIKIVTELNMRKVPAPGSAYRRQHQRPATWSSAALHGDLRRGTGLLNNPLYTGRYVWNRSRRQLDPDTHRRAHVVRDKTEWIETAVPQLRIIDDELWERVTHRRRDVSNGVAALRASLHCRVRSTGRRPKYLFSGLLVCGQCGGKFIICESTKYACSTWRTRGEPVCSNAVKVSRKLVETLLLAPIQRDLFTEDGLDFFKREVLRLLAERRRSQGPDVAEAQARLHRVDQDIANIMAAIKAGILTPTTKAELEKLKPSESDSSTQHTDITGPWIS